MTPNGIILKPAKLVVGGAVLFALIIGAALAIVLGSAGTQGPSKDDVFVSTLESANIPVGSKAVETAHAFCSGNAAGEAAAQALASLAFAGDSQAEYKSRVYIQAVADLCN